MSTQDATLTTNPTGEQSDLSNLPAQDSQSKAESPVINMDSFNNEFEGLIKSDDFGVAAKPSGDGGAPKAGEETAEKADASDNEVSEEKAAKLSLKASESPKATDDVKKPDTSSTAKWPAKRDYSGLSDDEIRLFKQMNNESFARLKPIFIEHRELQEKLKVQSEELSKVQEQIKTNPNALPPTYFEHPQAFILDKQYQQGTLNLQTARQFEEHWNAQLLKIKSGEDWDDLVQNDKGEWVIQTRPADPKAEIEVNNNIYHSRNQTARVQTQLENIQNTFKQRHDNVINFVKKDIEDKYFPFYAGDALNKPQMAEHKKIITDVVKAFPDELRSNPMVNIVAKAFAVIMDLSNRNKQLQKSATVSVLSEKDKKLSQPTAAQTSAGSTSSKRVISIEDFNKELD